MIVVSDTSPLNYLVLIGAIDVLPALFGRVVVPPSVLGELQHSKTPAVVQAWATAPPAWLDVRLPNQIDSTLGLGAGEAEAISLALELAADQLLVDERAARRVASDRGLVVAGTLGVLVAAARRGLIDLDQTTARLQATTFRASPAVWQKLKSAGGQSP